MATNPIPVPRGGEDYTVEIGLNADNNSVLVIRPNNPDPKTGAMVKYEVDELRIPFGLNSNTAYIYTRWRKLLVGPTGEVIEQGKLTYKPDMISNGVDQATFIAGMGMPILMSMVNGFFRSILGFNNLPVFNTQTGAVIQYTPEELAAPPTWDYSPKPTQPPTEPV